MRKSFITDSDRLALIDDLNEKGTIEGHDDYQTMIRRALTVSTYEEGDILRADYEIE